MLPPELWALVLDSVVKASDLFQVSLVNRQFHSLVTTCMYNTVHLYGEEQLELFVRALQDARDDYLGNLVRRVFLYDRAILSCSALGVLPRLTPNLRFIDCPAGHDTRPQEELFPQGLLWSQLEKLPLWMNIVDWIPRQLSSLECGAASIYVLAQQFAPIDTLRDVTVERTDSPEEFDRDNYLLVDLLDAIQKLAPFAVRLKVQPSPLRRREQVEEVPPAVKQAATTVRSLHVDVARLDQWWLNYFHAKYPHLTSLSINIVFKMGRRHSTSHQPFMHVVNACQLESLHVSLISALRQPVDIHQELGLPPLTIADGMMGCVASRESRPMHAHSLKRLNWHFDTTLPNEQDQRLHLTPSFVFDQLVELSVSVVPGAAILCWLRTCSHHPSSCPTVKNQHALPLLKKLLLDGPAFFTSDLDIASAVSVRMPDLLGRFPHLAVLELRGLFDLQQNMSDDLSAFQHRHLRGMRLLYGTTINAITLQNIIYRCPSLVDLWFEGITIRLSFATQLPIIIEAADRDFGRLYTVRIHCDGGVLLEVDPIPFQVDTSTTLPPSPQYPNFEVQDPAAHAIVLRCRSVFRHLAEAMDEFNYNACSFSFDAIHSFE
ncbi:hypothetical protein BC940DRAFT_290019 [Gongronella butleri]|nr:hypothetical protein BC940DRAFT_290019 [Gongronella butleri]